MICTISSKTIFNKCKISNNIIYLYNYIKIYLYNLFYILNVIIKTTIYPHGSAGSNLVYL